MKLKPQLEGREPLESVRESRCLPPDVHRDLAQSTFEVAERLGKAGPVLSSVECDMHCSRNGTQNVHLDAAHP
jgi:hypothetical protein